MDESSLFTIIVGTYDKALWAWDVHHNPTPSTSHKLSLTTSFIDAAHLGCVKTVATGGNFLASGGTDEAIKIFNIEKKCEVGALMLHEDSITCIQFFQSSHMMTGCNDGTIGIWRTSDWGCLKVIAAHKDAVNSISIHPSGKLALSCSRDRSLCMWNMSNGRAAYNQQLTYEAEIIAWSPSGESYAIASHHAVHAFSLKGEKLYEYQHPTYHHICAMLFVKEDEIATGGEDREITVWNTKGVALYKIGGFDNRVKGLALAPKKTFPFTKYENFLVSISSDQYVFLWDLDRLETDSKSEKPIPVGSAFVDARLTCLAVSVPKKEEEEEVTDLNPPDSTTATITTGSISETKPNNTSIPKNSGKRQQKRQKKYQKTESNNSTTSIDNNNTNTHVPTSTTNDTTVSGASAAVSSSTATTAKKRKRKSKNKKKAIQKV